MSAGRSHGSLAPWLAVSLCLSCPAGVTLAADDTRSSSPEVASDPTPAATVADETSTAATPASEKPAQEAAPAPQETAPAPPVPTPAPQEAAPAPQQAAPAEPPAAPAEHGESSRFSEEPIPLQKLPSRPRPLLELGAPFLGTGTLGKGFTLPGGATWQPQLLIWGGLRSAVHDVEQGDTRSAAWLNRLDLNSQLYLTPTERVFASFRPLDENGKFTGYTFEPVDQAEDDHFNASVRTLYFEGDFGEMFPNLDRSDSHALDYGFAVGRMPIFFEEGMLIDDPVNAVGIVRNSLHPTSSWANLRVTGIFGWGNLNRGGTNLEDKSAKLFGLFTEFDTPLSTVDFDAVYVSADAATGDGLYGGFASIQRIAGSLNSTFRVLGSYALDNETAAVGRGVLLYSALSWTPRRTDDLIYFNTYGAIKRYTAVGRDSGIGGPLGLVGILYEGVGLGVGYGAVLPNQAKDSFGGALGYQKFFNHTRTQIIFELAGRKGTEAPDEQAQGAFGIRFQQAIGRHLIARVEGFGHARESQSTRYGGRGELFLKF